MAGITDHHELTHFTEKQFFYMLSRNRSVCGVKPCVRATCNPDADSWVADFIAWWIDPNTGYPVPERSGAKRYMCRMNDQLIWADTKQQLINGGADEEDVKSVTFISSTLQDNQISGISCEFESAAVGRKGTAVEWKLENQAGSRFVL